jgi:TPR repeat protein
MKTPLTFLLAVTFLFLFSGSVYGDDFQDGVDAYNRKDYKEAVRLWQPLAEQGNAGAQSNLGNMYHKGLGVQRNFKEAVKWYRLSAEQGYAAAQYKLGWMYEKGVSVYYPWMYEEGERVPRDDVLAYMWWSICGSSGDEGCVDKRNKVEKQMSPSQIQRAQFYVGLMYDDGRKVPQDYKEALKWYRLAAEQGYADAQMNLGFMYYKGHGVPQDYKEAARLYRLLSKQGFARAQYKLGGMYAEGEGVPQDYKEAARLYRLSAEQGYAFAQYFLGWMYAEGEGVPEDYASAHMWWNICGSGWQGSQWTHEDCVKKRDIIEKKMSPSQIQKAQEMAKNWKPSYR